MSNFYDVAMFQAALEKKTHLLPRGNQSVTSNSQPKIDAATGSEATLVEADYAPRLQKKSSDGRQDLKS